MKKSLIALLLVVALVMTVSVFAVSAEETTAPDYSLATGKCPHCDVLWSEIQPTVYTGTPASFTTAGDYHYVLEADTKVSAQLQAKTGANVIFHLNGNDLNRGGNRPVNLYSGGTLYFVDAKDNGGSITGASTLSNSHGCVFRVETASGAPGGTIHTYNVAVNGGSATGTGLGGVAWLSGNGAYFYMHEGTTINGASCATNGGAIHVAGGHFIMDGGSIENCSSTGTTDGNGGGAVYVNTGSFAMSGGTIKNCTAQAGGGAVYVTGTGATAEFSGGKIEGCSAGDRGGSVAVRGAATATVKGTAEINGGKATGTAAVKTSYGGNFYVDGKAILKVQGGLITAGDVMTASAGNYGGGNIACRGGKLELSSGTISYGTAKYGGNIMLDDSQSMPSSISGDVKITHGGHNGSTRGGNIMLLRGTLNISGGTISDGKSTNGAGINIRPATSPAATAASGSATLNISGGEIINNIGSYNGGNIRHESGYTATINITGGTIGGGECTSASMAGGNLCVNSGATLSIKGTAAKPVIFTGGKAPSAGSIYLAAGNAVEMEYVNISGGEATANGSGGGNVLVANGSLTMSNCNISGGKSAANGGNIVIASGVTSAEITACNFTGGVADNRTLGTANATSGARAFAAGYGGNVHLASKNSISFDGCRFTDGVAGALTEEGELVTTTYTNEVATKDETATIDGRGGNISIVAGGATFTGCTIEHGTSYSGGGGGGNVYLNGAIGETTFDGCTITGGHGQNQSGNLQHHANGTVIITGKSYIANGYGGTWGANIGVTSGSAILKIDGETEINATGCSTYSSNGINIHISQENAQVHLLGNSRVVLGSVFGYHSIVWASPSATGTGKIYLGGNAFMDKYIELKVSSATATAPVGCVEVMEGFTGDALLLTFTGSSNFGTADNAVVGESGKAVNFGATAPAYLTAAANYANTGTIKVHSQGRSGYVTVYKDGVFTIAPYTAYTSYDPEATGDSAHIEHGLADLTSLPEGTAKVKLYKADPITLTATLDGVVIDMNNQAATITTNGYTFKPMNYRSDNTANTITPFTVDGEIELVVQDPLTNYQYLNVEKDGKWTSNRVQVELTKVSIRTSNAGIYYTTKISTNVNAASSLVDFGTAVTIKDGVESIGADFKDRLIEDGIMYTVNNLNETAAFSKTARSALISGILSTENDAATNIANAETVIVANSYVTAIVDGKEVKIMADEGSKLTYKEVIIKLNDAVNEWNIKQPTGYAANVATAANFYNAWADVFSGWDLEYLKAEAAKVA